MGESGIPVVLRLLFSGGPELSVGHVFDKLPEIDQPELVVVPDHPLLAQFSVRDDTVGENEVMIFVYINDIGEAKLLKGPFRGRTVPLVTCSVMPLPESESPVHLN